MNNSIKPCDNSINENNNNNNNDNEESRNDNLTKLTRQSTKTVQIEKQLSATVNEINYRAQYFGSEHDENKIDNKLQTKSNERTNEEILNTVI